MMFKANAVCSVYRRCFIVVRMRSVIITNNVDIMIVTLIFIFSNLTSRFVQICIEDAKPGQDLIRKWKYIDHNGWCTEGSVQVQGTSLCLVNKSSFLRREVVST